MQFCLFFPILTNKNWYISVYLGFYAFLPFFQIIDRNIDQKKHLYLLGLLFFFNILFPSIFPFGDVAAFYYNRISLFIFYFYVGSYLKKYSNNKIENLYLCIAVALVSLTIIILRPFFISNIIGASFSNNPYFGFFFENNSLFTMLFVVSIFNIFKKIQISSKIINFISAGTLAVYLIHDNAMMRLFLWRKLFKVQDFQNNQYLVIYIVFVAVLVLICFSLIDILRRFIFNIFTKNK